MSNLLEQTTDFLIALFHGCSGKYLSKTFVVNTRKFVSVCCRICNQALDWRRKRELDIFGQEIISGNYILLL